MFLGGLQKNSFIDYPGKMSCVLFFSGCNFSCPYCHNPDLATGAVSLSPLPGEQGVFDFLERRRGFLDGVVISGGEPTIKKGLHGLCAKIKKMGYPVKLDTNGSRPRMLKSLIQEGLVDYVAMDIKTDPLDYSAFTKEGCNPDDILASIRVLMESTLDYEFRTTCVRPLVNRHIMENIATAIRGARLYALQRFHNSRVLHPEFFTETGSGYGEEEMGHLKSIVEPWVQKCILR